ncbi:MAG: xanthine dehydrogenase family protein molybdopterin-binding subunit [Polyangiaceae bacterium]|jgi:isoquinoline 1-oxidoreductase subunit beta|nr:xanthine dehydrogenase family protein molybdopterin-binding subunit [Polyangiaceae bacterium]
MSLSRRQMLAGTGAGLVLSFTIEPRSALAAPKPPAPKPLEPNAFLRIAPDESVTVLLAHSEMGQGIWTGLAMVVAEELGCAWSKIRSEHAPAAPAYAHPALGIQMTGGSMTTWSEFDRYRKVGAMAREMLVRAAAETWKVAPGACTVAEGVVTHQGKSLTYGQLAPAAMALKPPAAVKLKDPATWTVIGKPTKRLDTPEKITGRAQFGLDVKIPNLRTALIARPPAFGATVTSFDPSQALQIKGVEKVVRTSKGVAVVAAHFWAAKLGRDALKVEWSAPPEGGVDSKKLLADYRARARTAGAVAETKGDVDKALGQAKKKIELEYDVPYLAHAPMEPLNCTVKIDGDQCEIWTGTQFQTVDQGAAAKVLGVAPTNVKINTTFLGGGFGRRANPASDFVVEAVEVAKAAGVPVKVVWTREDDLRGGYYRPAFVHRAEIGVDERGMPVAWKHTVVGQSILGGTPFAAMVKNGIDNASVEGVTESPYLEGIGQRHISLHSPTNAVTVLWWRSVGNTHTAFAMESAIDELAAGAQQDPLAFRLALLKGKPRHAAALSTAANAAGWGKPQAAGRALGLAVHESFGSIVAQAAEVSVSGGRINVHRVVCAVDCGPVVNPLGVEAQVQGSVAFGLSAALHGQITLKDGRVDQSNFHDYQVLRMHEMPKVQVIIIPSKAKMGGIGEPATAPIAPAVANAVFALTKQRLRSLPFRLEGGAS